MVKISGIAGGEKVTPEGTDLAEIEDAGGTSYYAQLANILNALGASATMAFITGSTFSTVQHMQDVFHSTGITTGGGITDDTDGTITVAAGTGLIRATDSDVAEIVFTNWAAEAGANVALVDNDMNYLYVEYNAGSPQVVATITPRTDTNTNIKLGTVYRVGTDLHITNGTSIIVVDHAAKMELRLQDTMPFARVSGGILSEIGTRNIAITAGSWWEGLLPFTTPALDTSVAGTFTYYYSNGAGGFTAVASSTQIDNLQYDDGSGTLATLSNNKYGIHWIYAAQDSEYYAMYGTIDGTLTEAQDAGEPASLPPHFAESHARLIGKIIILKSASTFQSVQSAFNQTFSLSAASDHGGLVGLADDDHSAIYPAVTSGAGAPSSTPSRIGLRYVDTTNDIDYFSVGTASSADWESAQKLIDDGALSVTFNRIIGSDSDDTAHRELTGAEAQLILNGNPIAMADALLSRSEIKDYAKTQNVQATATGATTLDLVNGNEFFLTLTGNITLTFSNPPATGKVGNFTLKTKQDATGSRTITWPGSVDWAGGTAPTISTAANAVDFFTFHTDDAGTIWYGFNPGLDMK